MNRLIPQSRGPAAPAIGSIFRPRTAQFRSFRGAHWRRVPLTSRYPDRHRRAEARKNALPRGPADRI